MLLITGTIFAQSSAKIKGQVFDGHKTPLTSATVSLMRLNDSSLVKAIVSSDSGRFEISSITENTYFITVAALGFKTYSSTPIIFHQQNIQLTTIQLHDSAAHELQTVTVVSSKPFVEQKIDRTIVNVDALISNTGANALEVLEKSPGVLVDENGNISYKGKTGILVLIDDKPTYLSASDLATYLRSLPSSTIDKIELMDNPPAKYEAAGIAVINIKTKKSKLKGFNSIVNASYAQGFYWRYNAGINMNYRSNKINLFANLGTFHSKNNRTLTVDRNYFDANGDPTSSFLQTTHFTNLSHSSNLKLGMDYYISPKTTWGIVYTGSLSLSEQQSPGESLLYDNLSKLDSTVVADNYSKSRFSKAGVNINYSHQFDTAGRSLSFDIDYIKYYSNSDKSFLNSVYAANGMLLDTQKIVCNLPSYIHIYSFKADYTHPLKNKAKIEAGIKSSYVTTDNAANYFNVINGMNRVDYSNTNQFLYKENINALYFNYNKEFKRFSLQTGLRLENTNGFGDQLGNIMIADSSFEKHYSSLFPTAFFSYKLDTAGNHLLNFSYGRRIGRPDYQDLNPFVFIINKYAYFSGNPFLRPQFSGNSELSYHYKGLFTTSIIYNHVTDFQSETIEQSGNVFVSRTGNIGEYTYMAFTVNLSLKPTKWWNVNIFSDYQQNEFKGALYNGYIDESSHWMYVTANNQFSFKHGWSGELSGFYVGKRRYSQFDMTPNGQLNAGLQKKLLHDKATLKLNVRDIFHTNTSGGYITNVPNAIITYHNVFDTQVVTLGFTYSFGKQMENKPKRNTGGVDSEADRVKN